MAKPKIPVGTQRLGYLLASYGHNSISHEWYVCTGHKTDKRGRKKLVWERKAKLVAIEMGYIAVGTHHASYTIHFRNGDTRDCRPENITVEFRYSYIVCPVCGKIRRHNNALKARFKSDKCVKCGLRTRKQARVK